MIKLHKLVNSSVGAVSFFALGGGGALRMGARVLAAFLSSVPDPGEDVYGGGFDGVGGGGWERLVRTGGVGL